MHSKRLSILTCVVSVLLVAAPPTAMAGDDVSRIVRESMLETARQTGRATAAFEACGHQQTPEQIEGWEQPRQEYASKGGDPEHLDEAFLEGQRQGRRDLGVAAIGGRERAQLCAQMQTEADQLRDATQQMQGVLEALRNLD